jgi:DNA polymerase-3 subunit alpha
MEYVSIHSHTTYSYMDGFGLPEEHVARVADLGMSALGLTEHGNVSSQVKLEQAALRHGIKPLFGLEAYTAPDDMREKKNMRKWHMTILAMDGLGFHNLNKITTRSWDEGFYKWPTVTGSILQDHHQGLIVTSGCSDGLVACSLLGGKGIDPAEASEKRANQVISRFKKLLGDRYYLEAQQFPELERTKQINSWLETAARRHKVPHVATSDVHYPSPEQNEMQKILHAAGRNTGTVVAAEAEWEYNIRLTYPISDAAIIERLRGTGLSLRAIQQAISSTREIADRCNVELPKMARLRYPVSQEPDSAGMGSIDLLRRWLNDGWKYRGFDRLRRKVQREYVARVEYETSLFVDKDFVDYFLMLSDLVRRAKDQGLLVGPARGSAAASLVCYLLRITEVNPMKFPLMFFERFVDPNRMDLPDIDLDFDDERRDEIRQLAIQRYGEDCVGNIGTFTRYRGKNAIDDVARVYQLPRGEIERVKEFLVERSGGDSRFDATIGDTVEMFPQVKEVFDKHPDLYKALELEGNYKGFGVHAAGLVIGSQPLWKAVASYTRHNVGQAKKTLQVMSVDKYDGEHVGLLKVDALGLSTMGMLRHAIEIIGMSLQDLYDIPLDDPETLAAFERADVVGIFQFEGRTMRMVTQELKPKVFMDLAAINALARPGPLHSGSTGDYLAVRHGRAQIEHLHPLVDEITQFTEYQIIYQEQMLQICRDIGKFPWVHAATIRKVISQKKGEAAFNSLWEDFKDGAASQGISEELADKIWRKMVTAGTYAFVFHPWLLVDVHEGTSYNSLLHSSAA